MFVREMIFQWMKLALSCDTAKSSATVIWTTEKCGSRRMCVLPSWTSCGFRCLMESIFHSRILTMNLKSHSEDGYATMSTAFRDIKAIQSRWLVNGSMSKYNMKMEQLLRNRAMINEHNSQYCPQRCVSSRLQAQHGKGFVEGIAACPHSFKHRGV
jgi:hypothetical protein